MKQRRDAILCEACGVEVDPGLVHIDDLTVLRSVVGSLNVSPQHQRPQPILCPWCGIGTLSLSEVDIDDPPNGRSTYHPIGLAADGVAHFRVSGWAPSEMWTGFWAIGPAEEDYELWAWIAKRRKRFPQVRDDEVDKIRTEYLAWCHGWIPWMVYRLTHRRRPGWVQSLRETEG